MISQEKTAPSRQWLQKKLLGSLKYGLYYYARISIYWRPVGVYPQDAGRE
jgi:hypothetical protein